MAVQNWEKEFEKIEKYQTISNKDVYEGVSEKDLRETISEYSTKRKTLNSEIKEMRKVVEKLNLANKRVAHLTSEIGLMEQKIRILKEKKEKQSKKKLK